MAKTQGAPRQGRGSDRLEADDFRLGYRAQTHWDWSVGAAFFFAEWGAGVFLVAMLAQELWGMVLGLLLVGIGKSGFQLLHTGVRRRAWRSILRPDRSWISRGALGVAAFIVLGSAHVVAGVMDAPDAVRTPLAIAAAAAALLVATYQGFAMAHSTAIAVWSTALMPIASLVYSLASGVATVLLLQSLARSTTTAGLNGAAVGFVVGLALLLPAFLHGGRHGSPGNQVSIELLRTGATRRVFDGVVVGAGVLLPALAFWLAAGSIVWIALGTAGILAGFVAFRILILQVGVFEPVRPF